MTVHYIPDATDTPAYALQAEQISDAEQVKQFLFAGKAVFTLRSVETQTRYTYRINKSKDGKMYFCSLLTGPNNEEDFNYFGQFFGNPKDGLKYVHGKPGKACASRSSESIRAFCYVLQVILDKNQMPRGVEFWHEGRCGRCARKLTDPDSITAGFGPECIGMV